MSNGFGFKNTSSSDSENKTAAQKDSPFDVEPVDALVFKKSDDAPELREMKSPEVIPVRKQKRRTRQQEPKDQSKEWVPPAPIAEVGNGASDNKTSPHDENSRNTAAAILRAAAGLTMFLFILGFLALGVLYALAR